MGAMRIVSFFAAGLFLGQTYAAAEDDVISDALALLASALKCTAPIKDFGIAKGQVSSTSNSDKNNAHITIKSDLFRIYQIHHLDDAKIDDDETHRAPWKSLNSRAIKSSDGTVKIPCLTGLCVNYEWTSRTCTLKSQKQDCISDGSSEPDERNLIEIRGVCAEEIDNVKFALQSIIAGAQSR